MTDESVLLDVDDGVATITLNQPERLNAFSLELKHRLADVLDEIDAEEVRCIVLQGAGDAFSAGGDLERMQEAMDDGVPVADRVRELEETTNELIVRLVRAPVPTIAKVDGAAVGAGANLAVACDIQLASDRARIGFVFRNIGLSVDSGSSYFLPRLVGENVAKELVLTGEIVDADRALELGLVNHVYPADSFEERAAAMIERIATGPTVALRQARRLLSEGLGKSLEQALHDETAAQAIPFESADHAEGVAAFLERRDATFRGR